MLDHITISVADYQKSKMFYTQALKPLGYSLLIEVEGYAGFGDATGFVKVNIRAHIRILLLEQSSVISLITFMNKPLQQVAKIMAHLVYVRIIILIIMVHLCMI
jgi:hypothetical protein